MSYQPVPAPKRPLSKGKKIAIGVAVLLAVPPFIAGAISGAKDSNSHDSATAPTASHSRPATKTPAVAATPHRKPAAQPEPGPAQKLADLDSNAQPVAAYQRALDALAPKCTQDRTRIAAIGNATLQDLQKNGVTDETELSVLRHLNDSLPAGSPRTDCVSIAAAYATLREGG